MLERGSSCLEPASQLFLRHLDLPIRSSRALGSGYWKNAADQLPHHLLPWWRSDRNNVPPSSSFSLQGSDGQSTLICRPLLRPPPSTKLSRFYTQHVALRPAGQASEVSNDTLTQPARSAYPGQHDQIQIQTLDADLEYYSHPQNEPSESVLNNINSLFLKIPNQVDYAARFLHVFSRSSQKTHVAMALSVFGLIDIHQRSRSDYNCAVGAAVTLDLYQRAGHINAEAAGRGLDQDCSASLLICSVSNRLWTLAAQVWSDSFVSGLPGAKNAQLLAEIARQTHLQQKLPGAILELGRRLRPSNSLTWELHGSLVSVSSTFQHLLVMSDTMMNRITPKALLEILQTQSSSPKVHRAAIGTLHKSGTRSDRGAVAMLVYRHLRSSRPDYQPSARLMGALISIHCQDAAPAEILTYLLKEFATHLRVPDRQAYQKVLSALSKQGDVTGAQHVFLELCRVHGRPVKPDFYSPLIYAYARVADAEGAHSIFSMMEKVGVAQNTYCWNALLHAYVRANQPERALQLFQSMIAQQVPLDEYTFGTLMSIYSSSGDIDQVIQVVNLAQQHNIDATYEMIAGVVHSHCLNDQIDAAVELAVVSTKSNHRGSPVKMWNHILRYYAFHTEATKLVQIQEQMHQLGVQPDGMSYAALMTALIVIGKTAEASQILRSLDIEYNITASRFHYAIVLQGYLLEGNRDMGQVIYHEMLQRFTDVGPSARLAIQRMQGQLSFEAGVADPVDTVSNSVADALVETSVADRATKEPQRGIARRRTVDAFPATFVEDLMKLLIIKGRFRQAELLTERFLSLVESSYLGLNHLGNESIPLLIGRLAILKSQRDWHSIEKTWERILRLAIRIGQPVGASITTDDGSSKLATTSQVSFELHRGQTSSLELPKSTILFSQRFILKDAITSYLGALAEQQLYAKAASTLETLQAMGFVLTSKNVNFYIQILTHSTKLEHNTLAFQLFEGKLLPNTPPWNVLVRGKWKASDSSERDTVVSVHGLEDRKAIEKRNPGLLMPTYFTCVHLAMVLREYQQLAGRGSGNTLPLLSVSKAAPGTFDFIRKIPHIPDRIQSVLLRDRYRVRGDRLKRVAREMEVDRSGILGSKSPVDHVPAEYALSLDAELAQLEPRPHPAGGPSSLVDPNYPDMLAPARDSRHDNHVQLRNVLAASARVVAQGQQYEGEIAKSYLYLDRKGRFETQEERHERLQNHEATLINVVQTMSSDVNALRTMSNMRFGHPALKPTLRARLGTKKNLRNGRLYNLSIQEVEMKARVTKRRQELQVAAFSDVLGEKVSSNISAGNLNSSPRVEVQKPRRTYHARSPRGPYGNRTLRQANDACLPRDVKLTAKLERRMDSLPSVLLRGFSRNREYRQRKAFRNKRRIQNSERRVQSAVRNLEAEEKQVKEQELLYRTLDKTVEMNRSMAEAAEVDQHALLQAQRREERKIRNQRILEMYSPERARRGNEAGTLAQDKSGGDEHKEKKK